MRRSPCHLIETVVSSQEQVLATQAVLDERDRQDVKWGSQRRLSDQEWLTILVEEVGEAAKDILDQKPDGLKTEVMQVAAVALAWLEALTVRHGPVCSVSSFKESHANPT